MQQWSTDGSAGVTHPKHQIPPGLEGGFELGVRFSLPFGRLRFGGHKKEPFSQSADQFFP
jgi:hypothetical protein